ncbi:hypothetical protein [Streptomyces sp. NPDC058297]|uniref:hypothetical protein n=1 Tax=unclassified Streptomyces TaxID=2593676 RepID=UPI0036E8398A
MTNLKVRTASAPLDLEGGLASLRGDCARMAPRWRAPAKNKQAPVTPSRIHGVVVPSKSARLIDSMSEYGD